VSVVGVSLTRNEYFGERLQQLAGVTPAAAPGTADDEYSGERNPTFTQIIYTLSVSVSGSGTVTSSPQHFALQKIGQSFRSPPSQDGELIPLPRATRLNEPANNLAPLR
jgi:hypothetical protein